MEFEIPKDLIGKRRKTDNYIKQKQTEWIINNGKLDKFLEGEQGMVRRIYINNKVVRFVLF